MLDPVKVAVVGPHLHFLLIDHEYPNESDRHDYQTTTRHCFRGIPTVLSDITFVSRGSFFRDEINFVSWFKPNSRAYKPLICFGGAK
jgi:hypothetical protein